MKIKVVDERYFPTLGILAAPGDEVDIPDEGVAVDSKPSKTVKNETVVSADGSAAQ